TGARLPARIVVSPSEVVLGVGRSIRLSATVFDEDGIEITNAPVSFVVDDANVATVDATGGVRALREGVTKIKAAAGEASAEMSLRVQPLSLVINEVLADPPDGATGDANHDGQRSVSQDEFIEIVNASDADIDLGGFRIVTRSAGGVETTRHSFAPGAILSPATAAVVFGGASLATFNPRDPAFAGALVSLASTGSLSLLNGGETVVLLDPSGATVEEMNYGGATGLAGDRNQSLTRAPDIYGDFTLHQSLAGSASRVFSPGKRVDGAPFATNAPISRIEIDPSSATTQPGSTQAFNARAFDEGGRELRGVIFGWQSSDESIAVVNSSGVAAALKVGATEIMAIARGVRSAPALLTVSPPPRRVVRVEIEPAAASLNRGATLQLVARAYDQNDRVVTDTTFGWGSDSTAIATVDQSGLARGVGVGVVAITATAHDGAGGTVSARATIEVKLPIVISEFLADVPPDDATTSAIEGDANRDGTRNSGDDEFVELFNPSDSPVDLSGVRIFDSTAERFTFPPNTRVEPKRAVVVFGGGPPPANDPAFGGALIFKASSLSLNDGGDTILLKLKVANDDVTLATQSYGTQGGTSAPSDQSLTRERDANGAPVGNFVAHLGAANAAGRAFSPGTLPDGSPFGSSPITRVEIAPLSATLEIGASQIFTARAFVLVSASEVELPNVSFAWDASAPALVSLAQASGTSTNATAIAQDTLTIRARAGNQQAVANVKVNPPPPILARVELSPLSATIEVGNSQQFTARAFDQYDHAYAPAQISFASSDAIVVTIESIITDAGNASATATVTGRREGAARLSATAHDGASIKTSTEASVQVILPPPVVKRVVVAPASVSINRGQSQQFTAQAFDEKDQLLPHVSFTWTTTDAQIATVTPRGLARGTGLGTSSVVATAPDGTGHTISGQAALTVRAPLVINEILADVPPDNASTTNVEGDANRDGVRGAGDDEFVELLNNSDATLDLSGVVISDSTSTRFTFPTNTTLAAGQAVAVFGGGLPPTHDPAFGGALVFAASSLGLNDGGDIVNVKLPTAGGDIIIASQAYGNAAPGAPPAPSDQSLTRTPDAEAGSSGGSFLAHTV
ncbi:MAG: large repetitive protein, partial [Acidobacteriota bacterium]|nr:large repetitive protein [Acidobacteriota bacterium]